MLIFEPCASLHIYWLGRQLLCFNHVGHRKSWLCNSCMKHTRFYCVIILNHSQLKIWIDCLWKIGLNQLSSPVNWWINPWIALQCWLVKLWNYWFIKLIKFHKTTINFIFEWFKMKKGRECRCYCNLRQKHDSSGCRVDNVPPTWLVNQSYSNSLLDIGCKHLLCYMVHISEPFHREVDPAWCKQHCLCYLNKTDLLRFKILPY